MHFRAHCEYVTAILILAYAQLQLSYKPGVCPYLSGYSKITGLFIVECDVC